MELPIRAEEDRFTPRGRYRELQLQIRHLLPDHAIPILLMYAFDLRTRIGPYVFTDKVLVPGGPTAVAAALHSAGLTDLRTVLQLWNPILRPSQARIGGRLPELLLISSMQIHSAAAYRLIRDTWTLGDNRPLIIAGGPKAIYQPGDFFGLSPDGNEGADVAVTGEEFVLLEFLECILHFKRPKDSLRIAFERARRADALNDIPGLVFRPDDGQGSPPDLINTGIQRLVRDLDELPLPFDVLESFEPPHQRSTLSLEPLSAEELRRHARVMTLVTTRGCKFRCPYCPIAAYNQSVFRHKSGARITEEIAGIATRTRITSYFGCDDNFFNHRDVAEEILSAMTRGQISGKPFRNTIEFATEATESDVYKHRDLLPLARDAGLRALYFGLEDLTAELVKKGQSPEKTRIVFQALLKHGIAPMPMIIHYDGQPLWNSRGLAGLLNQVRFLRQQGALTCQITLLMPMVGSRDYENNFHNQLVISRFGNQPVEDYFYDGNRCIATKSHRPWLRQLNMIVAYAAFYNPLHLLRALFKFDSLRPMRIFFLIMGMAGLVKSVWGSRGILLRMVFSRIDRYRTPPETKYRLVAPASIQRRRVRLFIPQARKENENVSSRPSEMEKT